VLTRVLEALERRLTASEAEVLGAFASRDALAGRAISWSGGAGTAAGVDGEGRLVVLLPGGDRRALDAGEVHLGKLSARIEARDAPRA